MVVLAKFMNFDYLDAHVSEYIRCMPMVDGRSMANGKVAGSNGKIGFAHTLPGSISEELQEVFSTT